MNFLNTIEIKQLPRNSRVALEERANRVPKEFQTMTIDQGNIYIYIEKKISICKTFVMV